jgi:hypothetical protein
LNYWDLSATIVLGEDDEQVLSKRFSKGQGPKNPKIMDCEGSYLKSMADAHYVRVQKEKVADEQEDREQLVDILETNSKNRKKAAALQALAKRAPKRKAMSLGSILVNQ